MASLRFRAPPARRKLSVFRPSNVPLTAYFALVLVVVLPAALTTSAQPWRKPSANGQAGTPRAAATIHKLTERLLYAGTGKIAPLRKGRAAPDAHAAETYFSAVSPDDIHTTAESAAAADSAEILAELPPDAAPLVTSGKVSPRRSHGASANRRGGGVAPGARRRMPRNPELRRLWAKKESAERLSQQGAVGRHGGRGKDRAAGAGAGTAAAAVELKKVVVRKPVVGFPGINQKTLINSGTPPRYNRSMTKVTPPDVVMCVGNGFILHTVNSALVVYNTKGQQLTAITPHNEVRWVGGGGGAWESKEGLQHTAAHQADWLVRDAPHSPPSTPHFSTLRTPSPFFPLPAPFTGLQHTAAHQADWLVRDAPHSPPSTPHFSTLRTPSPFFPLPAPFTVLQRPAAQHGVIRGRAQGRRHCTPSLPACLSLPLPPSLPPSLPHPLLRHPTPSLCQFFNALPRNMGSYEGAPKGDAIAHPPCLPVFFPSPSLPHPLLRHPTPSLCQFFNALPRNMGSYEGAPKGDAIGDMTCTYDHRSRRFYLATYWTSCGDKNAYDRFGQTRYIALRRPLSPPPPPSPLPPSLLLTPLFQSGGEKNAYDRFGQTRYRADGTTVGTGLLVAASTTPDPTKPWNLFFIPAS
ncbi:unnamed protein product [Closterium sp. Naga37s-1]|nr:unnamed protein product [Closterium sp. Naga37s-1]